MVSAANWVHLLREHCQCDGDRLLYRFLADGERQEQTLTAGELDRRARAIAAELQLRTAAGERVVLLLPPGLDFVCALAGCLYAGAVAAPTCPPRSANQNRLGSRLKGILDSARPALVLSCTDLNVQATLEQVCPDRPMATVLVDQIPLQAAENWKSPKLSPCTPACLQYTSGTTSDPRGVLLTQGNLLHNSQVIAQAFGHTQNSRGVIWLPPYHDMGLAGGILQSLYVGFEVTLMSPMAFLQRPARWLKAISRYRGTTSGGPNFAYDLCVDAIAEADLEGLDLSDWQVAFNGAEPCHLETMERFAKRFEPYGFRRNAFTCCYGLAESTLMVSCAARNAGPTAVKIENKPVVACGRSIEGQTLIRIVDPQTKQICPDGTVGEIWIAGDSVAQGYWSDPQRTVQTFAATLEPPDGQTWLRSGDLGFMRDGELFVSGRLKDLIIVRGVNYFPHELERTAQASHPALQTGGGAAFSIEQHRQEGVVLVHELKRSQRQANPANIFDAVRSAIAQEHELEMHAIVLVRPGQLPRTSSGKTQRSACRERFLAGTFEPIAQWIRPQTKAAGDHQSDPSASTDTELEAWLAGRVAAALGCPADQIDRAAPLARYGIGSADAVGLAGEISQQLSLDLPATLLWDYPSLRELARYLASIRHENPAAAVPAASEGAA